MLATRAARDRRRLMTTSAAAATPAGERRLPLLLGGYAAAAEAAWMGVAQASEFLEPLRLWAPRVGRALAPRLPRLRVAGLSRREFGIAEAAFLLMAAFFFSALLGAVRQVLYNAQFGAGSQ